MAPACGRVASTGTASTPRTSLAVEVRHAPGQPAQTYTLTCDPPGGTLPGALEACQRLAAAGPVFEPLPADAICTQIYGGPGVAVVRGVHRGDAVDATVTRRNGCEIARYDRLMRVLGLK